MEPILRKLSLFDNKSVDSSELDDISELHSSVDGNYHQNVVSLSDDRSAPAPDTATLDDTAQPDNTAKFESTPAFESTSPTDNTSAFESAPAAPLFPNTAFSFDQFEEDGFLHDSPSLPPMERASSFADYDEHLTMGDSVYRGIPASAVLFSNSSNNTSKYLHCDSGFDFAGDMSDGPYQMSDGPYQTSDGPYVVDEFQSNGSKALSNTIGSTNSIESVLSIGGEVAESNVAVAETNHAHVAENVALRFLPTYFNVEEWQKTREVVELPNEDLVFHPISGALDASHVKKSVEGMFKFVEVDILKFNSLKHSWKCTGIVNNAAIVFKVYAWQIAGGHVHSNKAQTVVLELGCRDGGQWEFLQMVDQIKAYFGKTTKTSLNDKASLNDNKYQPYQQRLFTPEHVSDISNLGEDFRSSLTLLQTEDLDIDIQSQTAIRIANRIAKSPLHEIQKTFGFADDTSKVGKADDTTSDESESETSTSETSTSSSFQLVDLLKFDRNPVVERCAATVVATLCEFGGSVVTRGLVHAGVIQHLIVNASTGNRSMETRRQCCRALCVLFETNKQAVEKEAKSQSANIKGFISLLQSDAAQGDNRLQQYALALAPLIQTM